MQEASARGEKNWVLGVTALASFMMANGTESPVNPASRAWIVAT